MSTASDWDERYRLLIPDFSPTWLVVNAPFSKKPGRALDLACGTGGNALWLAEHGWQVTAVDASHVAINLLDNESARRRLAIGGLAVKTFVADLEKGEFALDANAWGLIVVCKYFQRGLFPAIKQSVVPGGLVLASALLSEPKLTEAHKTNSPFRVQRGELRGFFTDWELLVDHQPEAIGSHSLAEIIARRPG